MKTWVQYEDESADFVQNTRDGILVAERRLTDPNLSDDDRRYFRYHLALMKRALGEDG